MKSKTVFICKQCGNETPRWQGQCPACGAWNSIVEFEDKKMPAADFYKIYSSVFTPQNTFFCHIDAKDIEWMKNDDNTKVLFESERACDFCAWLY